MGLTTRTTCSSWSPRDRRSVFKPMNCPESTYIYKRPPALIPGTAVAPVRVRTATPQRAVRHSFRPDPRRHFVQDDAHIYLRPDQLQDEIKALLGEVYEVYGWFGMEPKFTFGTKPDKALGAPELWETAESQIKAALDDFGKPYPSSPRTAPSMRPRSTSRSRTP